MYNETVMDHFRNPRNCIKPEHYNAEAEIGNPECGDLVKIYANIDDKGFIQDIGFQTFGCPAAIACSSMITVLAKGKHIDQAEKLTKYDVANALGGLPERKMHCSNLGADCLRLAIRKYKKSNNIEVQHDILDDLEHKTLPKPNTRDANQQEEIELDLRGKECPMTFVYTKVALEGLEQGQILKVILDFPPAFTNVPNSVKMQKLGDILDEIHHGSEFIVVIKKS